MNLPCADQPIRLDLPAGPPADQAAPERSLVKRCAAETTVR